MKEQDKIMECLRQSPEILQGLVNSIPIDGLNTRRIPGKWSIHEHVCHLAEAEAMIFDRFRQFRNLDQPVFEPYLPEGPEQNDSIEPVEIETALADFKNLRGQMIDFVGSFDDKAWNKRALHHEYTIYNAMILLRHTLMHDHFHMYRIEELWLTKESYL